MFEINLQNMMEERRWRRRRNTAWVWGSDYAIFFHTNICCDAINKQTNKQTIKYSIVQYSTVQCSTVQYSTVQYSMPSRSQEAQCGGITDQHSAPQQAVRTAVSSTVLERKPEVHPQTQE